MNRKFSLGITFTNGDSRRPAIFSSYFGDFLIDYQFIGKVYYLCNALALNKEKIVTLIGVVSDKKENLEGWVELTALGNGDYEVHNLEGYKEERTHINNDYSDWEDEPCKPCIFSGFFKKVCKISPPIYIYLKRIKIENVHIPRYFNHCIYQM